MVKKNHAELFENAKKQQAKNTQKKEIQEDAKRSLENGKDESHDFRFNNFVSGNKEFDV